MSRRFNLSLFVFASTVIGGCAIIPFDQRQESGYAITDTSDMFIDQFLAFEAIALALRDI